MRFYERRAARRYHHQMRDISACTRIMGGFCWRCLWDWRLTKRGERRRAALVARIRATLDV